MNLSKKCMKQIEILRDEDIDYSDIPETGEAFWEQAKLRAVDDGEKLSALLAHLAEGETQARRGEFVKAFDVEGLISELDQTHEG